MPRPTKNTNPESTENITTLTEKVDIQKIINLFKATNLDMDENCFNTLIWFLESNGERQVNYKYAKEKTDGRLYVAHGFQNIFREVRAYLCHEDYIDIDFINCHPIILQSILEKERYDRTDDYQVLQHYNQNREATLKHLQLTKIQVLSVINDPNRQYKETNGRTEFLEAIQRCALKVGSTGKEIAERIQLIEADLLKRLQSLLTEKGVVVTSLVFDGLIVEKRFQKVVNRLLNEWNTNNPSFGVMIKPWDVPEFEFLETNIFDPIDTTVLADLAEKQSTVYVSINQAFYHTYNILRRTIRTVHWKTYYYKKTQRDIGVAKKLEYSFKIKGSMVPIKLDRIMNVIPQLFLFDRITYFPTTNPIELSLFPGFLPDKGQEIRPDYKQHIQPILHHIEKVWANDVADLNKYILDFFAIIVQKIPTRTETILVLHGDEGTGKSCVFEFLSNKIFGTLALVLTGCDKLTRNFNSHLAGKILVCLEELKGDNDGSYKHDLNRIKQIVTAHKIDLERKGIDVEIVDNGVNLLAFSNYEFPLPSIPGINRRLVMGKSSKIYQHNEKYFIELHKCLEHPDSPASFLEFLRNRTVK